MCSPRPFCLPILLLPWDPALLAPFLANNTSANTKMIQRGLNEVRMVRTLPAICIMSLAYPLNTHLPTQSLGDCTRAHCMFVAYANGLQAACTLLFYLELCNYSKLFIARLGLCSLNCDKRSAHFGSSSSEIRTCQCSRCNIWQRQTVTGSLP